MSTLLPVFMIEFILFFLSLSRFMFSILKTKRLQLGPDAQSVLCKVVRGAGSAAGRKQWAQQALGQWLLWVPEPSHLGRGSRGLPLPPVFSVQPLVPTTQLREAWGDCPVPDPVQYSIFFGWLLSRLVGLSNHVSNFLKTVCQISELIAAAFGGEYQFS